MEETTRPYDEVEGKPEYDKYLPDAVQVLVDWVILIFTTLLGYLHNKNNEE